MSDPTAEQILDWFVTHLSVKPFEFGGKVVTDKHGDTQLALTFVFSESPLSTYTLDIANNSYDEACLGELAGALNAARKLLGKPEVPITAKAILVEKVNG